MRKFIPWLISLVLLTWVISRMLPQKAAAGFDTAGFGQLPVLVGGRVMPMDTLGPNLAFADEPPWHLHNR